LGKAGHPKACDTAKHDCPLKRVFNTPSWA
jgi:hypothetical protein